MGEAPSLVDVGGVVVVVVVVVVCPGVAVAVAAGAGGGGGGGISALGGTSALEAGAREDEGVCVARGCSVETGGGVRVTTGLAGW